MKLEKEVLRVSFTGSVDVGKSTVIGRLLFDTNNLYEDQINEIKKLNNGIINLSQITDGLKIERTNGMTLDVAYRYFETNSKKIILADCPGHLEFFKNMITGSSLADISVLIIESVAGMTEQFKRHLLGLYLLEIKKIVICVNKMDLINYEESQFLKIVMEVTKFAKKYSFSDLTIIPINAMKGDNIVSGSSSMNWYKGNSLLQVINEFKTPGSLNNEMGVFVVQRISKDGKLQGSIDSGSFMVNELVKISSSRKFHRIKKMNTFDSEIDSVNYPMSLNIEIEGGKDIVVGSLIYSKFNETELSKSHLGYLTSFNEKPIEIMREYILKTGTLETLFIVKDIKYILDVNLFKDRTVKSINNNDVSFVEIVTSNPILMFESQEAFSLSKAIIIDKLTNETIGIFIKKREFL